MKLIVFLGLFVVATAYAAATPPVYDGPVYEMTKLGEADDEDSQPTEVGNIRAPRLTCDLFSFESQWFTPRSAACAAKCIAQGRRGGQCRNGICVCRRR